MSIRRLRLAGISLALACSALCIGSAAAQPVAPPPAGRAQLLDERLPSEAQIVAVRSVAVTFSPDQAGGRHRHPVPVFGYVVRGTILFQLEGEPTRTLTEGQAFYEPAGTVVLRFDNASGAEDAEFVAFYLLGPGQTETVQFLPPGDAD